MAGREIPGYYFDAEKNKYFKIVADPAALYSKTAVRKRKADEAVATEAARVERASRERVRRSRVGGRVEREMGWGDGRGDVLRGFVRGWVEKNPVGRLRGGPRWRVFDVDVNTGWLIYSDQRDVNLGNLPGMVPKTPRWLDPVYFGHADVQSITLSACKGFVLLTWLDSQDRSNVQVSSLNPSDDRDATYNLRSQRSFENTTIRCACAAPPNSPYTFAIGSDDCPILVLDQEMNQVSSPSGPSSPTLALTFLTESPHVLLAGKRSGQIPLLDLRVDGGGRGGLRHASSVARVVQAGENTVVVAGLQDRMCVYDLRFLKEKWKKDATRPVARMWGHRNEARHDVDLAVDRGTGLVAAAQVEGGGGVRVFDGQSGVEVGYVAGGQAEGEYVRQVRFVEGKHGVGLWVSRGAEIVEYSCRPDGRYV